MTRKGEAQDWPRHWYDTGCKLHPACLTCPLPMCIYEQRDLALAEAKRRREQKAA